MVKATTAPRPEISETDLFIPSDEAAPEVRPLGEEPYKYVFRSAPTKYLGLEHDMDCPDPKWDEPDDDPQARRWARFAKAAWLDRNKDPKIQAALTQAFFDNGGSRVLKFRYHRGPYNTVGTVTYSTDSDAIATVLRNDIRRGKLPFIAEIDQSRYLKVGDMTFANTEFGRAAAHDALLKHGGSLELVEK